MPTNQFVITQNTPRNSVNEFMVNTLLSGWYKIVIKGIHYVDTTSNVSLSIMQLQSNTLFLSNVKTNIIVTGVNTINDPKYINVVSQGRYYRYYEPLITYLEFNGAFPLSFYNLTTGLTDYNTLVLCIITFDATPVFRPPPKPLGLEYTIPLLIYRTVVNDMNTRYLNTLLNGRYKVKISGVVYTDYNQPTTMRPNMFNCNQIIPSNWGYSLNGMIIPTRELYSTTGLHKSGWYEITVNNLIQYVNGMVGNVVGNSTYLCIYLNVIPISLE